jgi:hypothetical protein
MNDRDQILGALPEGTYMYCIHCERTYKYGEHRIMTDLDLNEFLQMCPYEDCDGDTVMDSKEWEDIREHHPDYPEVPERGVVYLLN